MTVTQLPKHSSTNPLDTLDAYLSSDDCPEGAMALSDLDGFLTGIACAPVEIPRATWMKAALGKAEEVPAPVKEIVMARLDEVRAVLSKQDELIEPVFWQAKEGHVIAMDWCEGFMDAVMLAPDVWHAKAETPEGARLMVPILVHLFDDNGNSVFGLAQEEVDATLETAADAIPEVVPAIYALLRS
jgi:yecA family protein